MTEVGGPHGKSSAPSFATAMAAVAGSQNIDGSRSDEDPRDRSPRREVPAGTVASSDDVLSSSVGDPRAGAGTLTLPLIGNGVQGQALQLIPQQQQDQQAQNQSSDETRNLMEMIKMQSAMINQLLGTVQAQAAVASSSSTTNVQNVMQVQQVTIVPRPKEPKISDIDPMVTDALKNLSHSLEDEMFKLVKAQKELSSLSGELDLLRRNQYPESIREFKYDKNDEYLNTPWIGAASTDIVASIGDIGLKIIAGSNIVEAQAKFHLFQNAVSRAFRAAGLEAKISDLKSRTCIEKFLENARDCVVGTAVSEKFSLDGGKWHRDPNAINRHVEELHKNVSSKVQSKVYKEAKQAEAKKKSDAKNADRLAEITPEVVTENWFNDRFDARMAEQAVSNDMPIEMSPQEQKRVEEARIKSNRGFLEAVNRVDGQGNGTSPQEAGGHNWNRKAGKKNNEKKKWQVWGIQKGKGKHGKKGKGKGKGNPSSQKGKAKGKGKGKKDGGGKSGGKGKGRY